MGQIAPDPTAGEDLAAQTGSALSRLTATLAERELILDDLLRLRLFVRDPEDLPAIERAMDACGPATWPAVSVVGLPAGYGDPQVAMTLDAIAAPAAREHRRLGAHSVRLGPWVFLGAVTAPALRRDVPLGRRLLHESRALFAHVEELLRAQDAELRDVVKVGGWLSFPMRDYGPLAAARDALREQAGLMPASAAVQVGRAASGEALLAFEAIAFTPADDAQPQRAGQDTSVPAATPKPSRLARFYADARTAGGYVFTSGEVPDGRGPVRTQAREVYERLGAQLTAHAASPTSVVHQTVFVRRAGDGETVAGVAREFYGAQAPPPTTLLWVADLGFSPGCDVEIELVAAADGRSADAR